jgi:signal transduction histidine kinase
VTPVSRLFEPSRRGYIRGMTGLLRPLAERRTYLATLDLLLDLGFGIVWFSVFATGVAAGGGMADHAPRATDPDGHVPVRTRGRLGRAKARAPPARHRDRRSGASCSKRGRALEQARRAVPRPHDVEGIRLPLARAADQSVVNFSVALTAWAVPLWAITLPIYAVEWPGAAPEVWNGTRLDSWHEVIPVAVAGLLLLPLVPWIVRGLAAADAAAARWGLSPSRTEVLEERIGTLRETQARSVDIAIADRRQIERDLHDGAQQRLLALGMDLGMALDKFETDPEAARELVGDAHRELQRAVAELRNLARGIHPAVLTDRGLDAALSALAARSPVPVHLEVDLRERPPASIEATAYFIVAEALTNAARYANASAVDVRVRLVGERLRIEIADDGVDGAEQRPGGGLAGLADRASSVEGAFRITSPTGGPTIVAAELPCAS